MRAEPCLKRCRWARAWGAVLFSSVAALYGCAPSTGGGTLVFEAFAAGPEQGAGEAFTNSRGYEIQLTRAELRLGAVYLNQYVPRPGSAGEACALPGVYVAEVTQGLSVDLLQPELQPFPGGGVALEERAASAEVWLLGEGSAVDAVEDPHVIFSAAGTATRDGVSWPFEASVSIGSNRLVPAADPKKPGANPICAERIVSPIPVNVLPRSGGRLVVRVQPAAFFSQVEFAELEQADAEPPLYRFRDVTDGQPNINLYRGLHSTQRAYSISWE